MITGIMIGDRIKAYQYCFPRYSPRTRLREASVPRDVAKNITGIATLKLFKVEVNQVFEVK
jgi:hypothetical protein